MIYHVFQVFLCLSPIHLSFCSYLVIGSTQRAQLPLQTTNAPPPPPGPRAYVARSYEKRVATPLTAAKRTAASEDGIFCKNFGRVLERCFALVRASLRWVDKRCELLSNVVIVLSSSTFEIRFGVPNVS